MSVVWRVSILNLNLCRWTCRDQLRPWPDPWLTAPSFPDAPNSCHGIWGLVLLEKSSFPTRWRDSCACAWIRWPADTMKAVLQSAVRSWEVTSQSGASCLIAFATDLRDEDASVLQDGIYGNCQVVGVQIFSDLFNQSQHAPLVFKGAFYFQNISLGF